MLVIRHSFIGDYFFQLEEYLCACSFSLEIKIFPHGIPMDVFFWFSLNLNILNLQAVESREISTLMDCMDRTRQTGILHLSYLKEGNTQLSCSLPTWPFRNPAHSSRIDIHSPFRATCHVSSPESVLSPWLVSDAVLHLLAQIMRFTTSLMSRISTEARASLHSFALCLEKIKGIRVESSEQGRHVQGSQTSSHLVSMMSKVG